MVIRADSSAKIGTGHIMRCLALAQAWRSVGGRAVFVTAADAPVIESRLKSEGFDVEHISANPGSDEDASLTCDLALLNQADIVVVDGYHFNSKYQVLIKNSGKCLLFVDDYGHAEKYYADFVLNQNIYASEDLYPQREPYTRLLLGSPYVLLRQEFRQWRGWQREIPKVAQKVLITLGGSDPDNVTLKAIKSLQHLKIEGLEAVVVVGGSNSHFEEIKKAAKSSCIPFPIRLVQNTSSMPELMAWADIAVSSAGTTSWELAFMGLPSLSIVLADNQVKVAEKLAKVGVAVNMGWHDRLSEKELGRALMALLSDPLSRASMADVGRSLVDGQGSMRAISSLLERFILLREAHEDDCEMIYKWANDPNTRAASFSTGPIAWEEHIQWFGRTFINPDCMLFIALDIEGHPVGQVRFEMDGSDGSDRSEATISISIDSNFRGRGLGSLVILRASEEIFKRRHISRINAFIKPQNRASIRAFEKAGFSAVGMKIIKGNEALHYIKENIRENIKDKERFAFEAAKGGNANDVH